MTQQENAQLSANNPGGDYGKGKEISTEEKGGQESRKEGGKKGRDKGEVIRVSRDVLVHIRRKQKAKESNDATLRRLFGLANRKGESPQLRTYFVLTQPSLTIYDTAKDARGAAVQFAVKKKSKKAEAPIRVKEAV